MLDHTLEGMPTGSGGSRVPLRPSLVVGAAALTAGLAYAVWPSTRFSTTARRRRALVAYLSDHLGGADVAIRVVRRMVSTHQGTEDAALFLRLSRELEEDRSVVRTLMDRLGGAARPVRRAAGYASGAVAAVTAGGDPSDLSLFLTLEALSIGVQGKRCMWRALQDLPFAPSTTAGISFPELEARAVRQWDAIEHRRRALVTRTFSTSPAE